MSFRDFPFNCQVIEAFIEGSFVKNFYLFHHKSFVAQTV